MAGLSVEALMTLVAIGWVDGELHAHESAAILRVARAQGLDEADLARISEAFRAPVRLGDPGDLPRAERLFLYGLARWLVQVDGVVTSEEHNVVDAIAMALRIAGRGRKAVDAIVARIGEERGIEPERFDVDALRSAIAEVLG